MSAEETMSDAEQTDMEIYYQAKEAAWAIRQRACNAADETYKTAVKGAWQTFQAARRRLAADD